MAEWQYVLPVWNFNSRPSARGDISSSSLRAYAVFQFTPLREGRRYGVYDNIWMELYFNSRPSARGDLSNSLYTVLMQNFNSRPSARGDWLGHASYAITAISIHAPPRGATLPV